MAWKARLVGSCDIRNGAGSRDGWLDRFDGWMESGGCT